MKSTENIQQIGKNRRERWRKESMHEDAGGHHKK
jgi:hypothetical protein